MRWLTALVWIVWNFFFFQAEDGIRDVAVTGVQTCALPIWASILLQAADGKGQRHARIGLGLLHGDGPRRRTELDRCEAEHADRDYRDQDHQHQRSEERRVGKECRSRWSPEH